MLTAADGTPDTFRIKVWHEIDGFEQIVYDNMLGLGDDDYDGIQLGGGNISIHKSKH